MKFKLVYLPIGIMCLVHAGSTILDFYTPEYLHYRISGHGLVRYNHPCPRFTEDSRIKVIQEFNNEEEALIYIAQNYPEVFLNGT